MLDQGTYEDCTLWKLEALEAVEAEGETVISVRMHLRSTLTSSSDEEESRRLLAKLLEVEEAIRSLRKIGNKTDIGGGKNTFKLKIGRPFAKQVYQFSAAGEEPVSCIVRVGGDPEVHVVEGEVLVRWKGLSNITAEDAGALSMLVRRDDITISIKPEQSPLWQVTAPVAATG